MLSNVGTSLIGIGHCYVQCECLIRFFLWGSLVACLLQGGLARRYLKIWPCSRTLSGCAYLGIDLQQIGHLSTQRTQKGRQGSSTQQGQGVQGAFFMGYTQRQKNSSFVINRIRPCSVTLHRVSPPKKRSKTNTGIDFCPLPHMYVPNTKTRNKRERKFSNWEIWGPPVGEYYSAI